MNELECVVHTCEKCKRRDMLPFSDDDIKTARESGGLFTRILDHGDHLTTLKIDPQGNVRREIIFSMETKSNKIKPSVDIIQSHYVAKFTGQSPEYSVSNDAWPVISQINGQRTISEIAKRSGSDLESVFEVLSMLKSQDVVTFQAFVNMDDILVLTPKGTTQLIDSTEDYQAMSATFGDTFNRFIKVIDGSTPVIRLTEKLSMNILEIKELLEVLLKRGYVEPLAEEFKGCLILDTLYVYLKEILKKIMGKLGLQVFDRILEEESDPLVRLINLTDDKRSPLELMKIYIEGQTDINFLELQETFLSPILKFFKYFEDMYGHKSIAKMRQKITEKLKSEFGSKNIETIEKILAG